MSVLTVGVGAQYEFSTIAQAVAASQSGDTIQVRAGTYVNDFTEISHTLTLQAEGGMVIMQATVPAPNGKAILTEGAAGIAVSIDGFAFTGATVPDGNGAGIRYEGGTLNVTNCLFTNNQNGILGASDPNGMITISHSEFAYNGVGGSGTTHNIYIGDINTFTLTDSFSHDANLGHEVKSRAENNIITNNRIFDNASTASYSIDLPNGGNATITGNIIEQGVNSPNNNIITYGEEGNLHTGTALTVSGNTIVNDLGSGPALWNASASTVATFSNNQIYGFNGPSLVVGAATQSGTVVLGVRPTLDESSPIMIGVVCYLRGTRIATPTGERRIEDLRAGDFVITLEGGEHIARPVKWVGSRRLDVRKHRQPESIVPICVQRHSFGDNLPHRDLYLSPDHAIFVDGKLICVRQLVNGASIRPETGRTLVDYFHIELENHAIILAEGLPAESYLDTGNRSFFAHGISPVSLHPDVTNRADHQVREAGSCAPFVCDDADVWRVWRRLADRAVAPGQDIPNPEADADPAPRIIAGGRTLWSPRRDDGCYGFILPPNTKAVRLVSRAGTLTDTQPWRGDRRRLGIHVERIVVRAAGRVLEVPMDHPGLSRGWWAVERSGAAPSRWTDGDAVLPLPYAEGPIILEIRASSGGMRYATQGGKVRGAA